MAKALIREGSIVQVLGVPVRLCEDVVVETNERSVALLTKDRDHGVTATVAPAPATKAAPILPKDVSA